MAAGGDGSGAIAASHSGFDLQNPRVQKQDFSFSSPSMKRMTASSTASLTSYATSSSSSSSSSSRNCCAVTPPMTLPSRGWGDSGGSYEGCGCRRLSGFSCHSGSADDTQRSGGGGQRSGSSSSGGRGLGTGEGAQQLEQRGGGMEQLKWFDVSEGFSSAEEETWGSEGEIEETIVAGRRRALVTLGSPSSHPSVAHNRGTGSSKPTNGSGDDERAKGADDDDNETQRLLGRIGSRPAIVPLGGLGGTRKAAVGAGRAKRRSFPGAAKSCGAGGGMGLGSGLSPGMNKSPPKKVSRPLFIEIENKASEPPPRRTTPPGRGRAAMRRQRTGAAAAVRVVGGGGLGGKSNARPGRRELSRSEAGEDADDEGGKSGDEAMCGCAARCLRLMDSWYHSLTGSTAEIKFSELDQAIR